MKTTEPRNFARLCFFSDNLIRVDLHAAIYSKASINIYHRTGYKL